MASIANNIEDALGLAAPVMHPRHLHACESDSSASLVWMWQQVAGLRGGGVGEIKSSRF